MLACWDGKRRGAWVALPVPYKSGVVASKSARRSIAIAAPVQGAGGGARARRVVLNSSTEIESTAARTARGRGSGTLAAAGGCTRGVREKGYTAASRRNGTEALARSRCRSGRCREQRPVLSDYS